MTIMGMAAEGPSGCGIAASVRVIDAAADVTCLRAGIEQARRAMAAELGAHTPALALAAAWSGVLRSSVAAGVRVIGGADGAEWSWYVSGSAARGEAAPGSDVETMVVLDDEVSEGRKVELMATAAAVHAVLERCGISGDANGVLASRPRFCRHRSSWLTGIEHWTAQPRVDRGVVMTGLTADSAGVSSGPTWTGDALRTPTVAAVGRSYPVRQAMLQDATALRVSFPSRLRIFAKQDTVDLKQAAIDPVVKIARWAGLSAGSEELTTMGRLDRAADAKILDPEDVSTLRECFLWLSRFRWRMRAGAWLDGRQVDDVVVLSQIAPHERAVLRSVAREVAGISRRLTYLASMSAFR